MKKAVLCGHTGSYNRGCNAIVKSTASVLSLCGIKSILATRDLAADEKLGLAEFESAIEYVNFRNGFVKKSLAVFLGRIIKNQELANSIVQKKVWQALQGNIALNVGGDTYCYSKPYASIYLNKYCEENGIVSVLWGCSIEKEVVEDPEIFADLRKYTYIFPRETLTYRFLLDAGIKENKLVLMSDPAFLLEPQLVDLPADFLPGNTVGLNLSPTVLQCSVNPDVVYKSFVKVIDYLLSNTGYSIALIPHVYNGYSEDLKQLAELYKNYRSNKRVLLLADNYNSNQLKYIISKLRCLIAARTHASIAAYSTLVPTLVLGYSVKAKGIACDLFGDFANYVLPVQELKTENALLDSFRFILESERLIKDHLGEIMPEYQNRAKAAADFLRTNIEAG